MVKTVACEIRCKKFIYTLLNMQSYLNSMHLYAFDGTKFVLMDVFSNQLFLTIKTGKESLNKW
jgi:hypothetical protein